MAKTVPLGETHAPRNETSSCFKPRTTTRESEPARSQTVPFVSIVQYFSGEAPQTEIKSSEVGNWGGATA